MVRKLNYSVLTFRINFLGVSHMVWNGHNYFLSWREPWHKFEDWDWFNGRNFCRDRCMDLVSFDTPGEYQLFAGIMRQGKCQLAFQTNRLYEHLKGVAEFKLFKLKLLQKSCRTNQDENSSRERQTLSTP